MSVLALLLSVLVWVVEPQSSSAQTSDLFTVDVSKTTDLVSGETIEVDVRTPEGSIVYPGEPSRVFTCQVADTYTAADFTDGTCVTIGAHLNEADNSIDGDRFHLFPEDGAEHGRRAITILRPGVGTAQWQLGGVQHTVSCGPDHPCRFVFQILVQTGSGAPVSTIEAGPMLQYRPTEGVVGCDGQSPDVVRSTMPDRLQDVWLAWTRDVCQTADVPPPTSSFFAPEGTALSSFAAGDFDLTYSAVGYRPGFDPPTHRPMVPVPIGLNAVVLAVGGGYPVVDGSWPLDFPKPHSQFRMTDEQIAILVGQWEQALLFSDASNAVLSENPQIPGLNFLLNSNVGAALALTGPQSTTLFASAHLHAVAPDQWKSTAGVPRGVETDFNDSEPVHNVGELDLKTGRPDLARIVYRELYSQGTYYVLTDLATANALGLTVVSVPDPAHPGDWITPSASTLAAAVPQMLPQGDGTLMPNPNATAGYPLTYVEYAMAPAQPLVDANCQARAGSQQLLDDWLDYVTTDGQGQLAPESGGLVRLTPALQQQASTALAQVGATPSDCTSGPPTTNPTTPTGPSSTTPPPASVTNPGSFGSGDFTPDSESGGASGGGGTTDQLSGSGARPARPATNATQRQAARAVHEAEIELPDLLGVRSINDLLPPIALLSIVVLSTLVVLATAGYPAPAALARLPGRTRRMARSGRTAVARVVRRGAVPKGVAS